MKKTTTAITLALVLSFGATFANAGILVADRATRQSQCSEQTTSKAKEGIIVFGRNIGIIVFGAASYLRTGIIVFGDEDSSCTDTKTETPTSTGIIVFG
jgi:hypothetical protein